MEVNALTAELCGIILGDGNLSRYLNRITITGSSDDVVYFKHRVIPLFKKCFPQVNPMLFPVKNKKAYQLIVENKSIFNFFIERFGLQRGRKDTAHVPEVIVARKELIPHFLRGLFDTDGCFKFCKQAKSYSYYPRIRIALMDSPIAHALQELLLTAGFDARKHVRPNNGHGIKDLVQYELSGVDAFERWMRVILPANPVQIAKYLYWKENGRHIPYLSLFERLALIKDVELVYDMIALTGFEPVSTGPKPAILSRLDDRALHLFSTE